ncbi:uncharacterized protein LOC111692819, partial [Anoplophora glabripennis]|uniref:uncharacterized protein LOC111692819 n=1 Tax=Anoplophora glabripennis TaxID=217634 RepID=UPI000C79229B
MSCGRTQLKRHAESQCHLKNVTKIKQNKKLNDFTVNETARKKAIEHRNNVLCLELAITTFFAEQNIALQNVDHLVELIERNVTDSKIVTDLELKRTKWTGLITNVVAKVEINDLIKILQKQTFSILCDESTDISTSKQLCIVRYINESRKIVTQLLEICHINARNGSAKNIYNTFKRCLQDKEIPLKNIVGMASDAANVM